MQIEVLQENLVQGLGLLSRVVPTRPQIPILANILVAAREAKLILVGGDGEVSIQTSVGAKIIKVGEICLPARTFVELVNSLPASKIELKTTESSLEITTPAFKGRLSGIPAAEYPKPERKKESALVEFRLEELKEALGKTIFAAAIDESRPALTGVLFRAKGNKLQLVATDAFRLSLTEIPSDKFFTEEVIIPAKTLGELLRVVAGKEGGETKLVKMGFVPGEVVIEVGSTEIHSRVIAGNYPNFEKIIPSDSSRKVILATPFFANSLKTAAVFARDSSNIVRLVISKDRVSLIASAPQLGEQEQELEGRVDGVLSEDFQIAFNYRYLLDLLASITSEEIILELSTPVSPAVFKIPRDNTFIHIVMPVRVQGQSGETSTRT